MMLSKNLIPFLMILVQMGPSFAHDGEHSPASPASHPTKIRKCVRKPKAVITTATAAPTSPKDTPVPDFDQVPENKPQQAPPTTRNIIESNEVKVEVPEPEEKPEEKPQEADKSEEKPEEVPQQAQEAPASPPSSDRPMDPRYVPADVLREMNQIRARNGKPPLAYNEKLEQNAYDQARYQSNIKKMTHDRPGGATIRDQLVSIGFTPGSLGENAAAGVYTSHDAVNSWEGSHDHFEIMMGDYKYMGTAMIDGYATAVFANQG